MSGDIKPRGGGEGKGRYWIKQEASLPKAVGSLRLVVIDETGKVEYTPLAQPWDDRALTKAEAVQAHLRGAVAEADRDLERRRRDAPPSPEKRPPPPDRATQKFFEDF